MCDTVSFIGNLFKKKPQDIRNMALEGVGLCTVPPDWGASQRFIMKGGTSSKDELRFSYVWYEKERFAISEMNAEVALSFQFSGCWMASFRYNNKDYVSHIAKDGYNALPDFIEFIRKKNIDPQDFVMFKPYACVEEEKYYSEYWGLIDKKKECYRIDLELDGQDKKFFKAVKVYPLSDDKKRWLCKPTTNLKDYTLPERCTSFGDRYTYYAPQGEESKNQHGVSDDEYSSVPNLLNDNRRNHTPCCRI